MADDWKPIYEAAVLELDPLKIQERIGLAEVAISRRLGELRTDYDAEECQQLSLGQTVLECYIRAWRIHSRVLRTAGNRCTRSDRVENSE
jgi:hypothetical protein